MSKWGISLGVSLPDDVNGYFKLTVSVWARMPDGQFVREREEVRTKGYQVTREGLFFSQAGGGYAWIPEGKIDRVDFEFVMGVENGTVGCDESEDGGR